MTRSSRNRVICSQREVPRGWVVIEVYHNPACAGDGDNALVIKRPGRREVVWERSPVPDGYRRLARSRSEGCPGDGDNAWVIEAEDDV